MTGPGFTTAEQAALNGFPPEQTSVLFLAESGEHAVVLLATNAAGRSYPYEVFCRRTAAGWVEVSGVNGPGWRPTGDSLGVLTFWDQVAEGTPIAAVRFDGVDHRCPVRRGYFLFTRWDIPEPTTPPVLLDSADTD
ncbi:hypothetical protein F0L68_14940 [Solihabitans fulvus]|uniref:Uncharacterized protein n=1 Tax=Solihabitans fulvus TaxID=1892852 RepID=A0A5B2XE15_9PSEU|nr:hypothetical protein [Solihabitans fulvus]KAA2261988.1 hypothetical protein F0L68_14940 [Solihabitans fulvus]